VRDFIVFEDDGVGSVAKKMAGYHQFHAVQAAVGQTLRAAELRRAGDRVADEQGRYEAGQKPGGKPGDRRVGVVWHTQGSGKSLTMAFYAGRIIREPAMENPTVVVLTDRLRQSSAPRSAYRSSRRTLSIILRSDSRPWTARRWSSV